MEAHNGKTRMGNSEVPLVVKFADAKRKDSGVGQACTAAALRSWRVLCSSFFAASRFVELHGYEGLPVFWGGFAA